MKTEEKRGGTDSLSDLIRQLVEDGWKEWPNHFDKPARSFFKRFETETRCRCNDENWGMQVQILVYPDGNYELKLAGELYDGTWVELHQWALPENVKDGIALIPRMLKAWECMSNDTATLTERAMGGGQQLVEQNNKEMKDEK